MSYYGDITRDYNNRYTKSFYAGVPLYLKFKTSPSAAVNLKHSYKLTSTTDESSGTVSYHTAQGATVKHSCCNKEVSSKFKVGNAGSAYEVTYKPGQYNNKDLAVQVKHATKFDHKSGKLDNTETLKVGSPAVSGARLWQTLDLNWNTADTNKILKGSSNIAYDKYNVGAKYDYDLKAGKVKSVNTQLAGKQGTCAWFLTYDITKRLAATGAEYKVCSYGTHGFDLVYDVTGKKNEFFGKPLNVNWAGQYQMSNDALFKFRLALGAQWVMGWSWIHTVNNKLKLTFTQDLNISKSLKGSNGDYKFGAQLEWTL